MNLHNSEEDFEELIKLSAKHYNLPSSAVGNEYAEKQVPMEFVSQRISCYTEKFCSTKSSSPRTEHRFFAPHSPAKDRCLSASSPWERAAPPPPEDEEPSYPDALLP